MSSKGKQPKTPPPPPPRVFVQKGLAGQDENLDLLQKFFTDMRTMTVEATVCPELDLITFAISAHQFGVIMLETQQGTNDCSSNSGSNGSQNSTSNVPLAPAPTTPIITEEEFIALPEKERQRRWREAFQAKLAGEQDESDDESDLEDVPAPSTRPLPTKSKGKQAARPAPIVPPAPGHHRSEERTHNDPFRTPAGSILSLPDAASAISNPDSAEDLINWPDDESDAGAPPSSFGDGSSCHGDESSMEEAFSPFDQDFDELSSPFEDNFGREYLEPEQGPVPPISPIPEDPAVKKMVMESALRLQLQMQARTVRLYEEKKARKAAPRPQAVEPPSFTVDPWRAPANGASGSGSGFGFGEDNGQKRTKPIGLIYLTTSQNLSDPLHLGECNIGVYVCPEHRNRHQIVNAVNSVVEEAFRQPECHRLQAILVDHPDKLDFLTIFTSVGFRHEGTRRHAYFCPIAREWKDVVYLAIVATEWVYDQNSRSDARLLPSSLWEEVLTRHQREQEEIVALEERKFGHGCSSLKRTSSTETIREVSTAPTPLNVDTGAESSGFSTDSSQVSLSPKRRKISAVDSQFMTRVSTTLAARRASVSSQSGLESDWEMPNVGGSRSHSAFSSNNRGVTGEAASSGWSFLSDSGESAWGEFEM